MDSTLGYSTYPGSGENYSELSGDIQIIGMELESYPYSPRGGDIRRKTLCNYIEPPSDVLNHGIYKLLNSWGVLRNCGTDFSSNNYDFSFAINMNEDLSKFAYSDD